METGVVFVTILAALLGVLIATAISVIPGLHIYNVIAITMFLYFIAMDLFTGLDPVIMTGFMLGMVVTFAMLFTVRLNIFNLLMKVFGRLYCLMSVF